MNRVQRFIEQGLTVWVVWVVGVVVYYYVINACIEGYEAWFPKLSDGEVFVFLLLTIPVYMYGLFTGSIRLYRRLRSQSFKP